MESKQTLDSEVHLEMKTNGHLSVVFFFLERRQPRVRRSDGRSSLGLLAMARQKDAVNCPCRKEQNPKRTGAIRGDIR